MMLTRELNKGEKIYWMECGNWLSASVGVVKNVKEKDGKMCYDVEVSKDEILRDCYRDELFTLDEALTVVKKYFEESRI